MTSSCISALRISSTRPVISPALSPGMSVESPTMSIKVGSKLHTFNYTHSMYIYMVLGFSGEHFTPCQPYKFTQQCKCCNIISLLKWKLSQPLGTYSRLSTGHLSTPRPQLAIRFEMVRLLVHACVSTYSACVSTYNACVNTYSPSFFTLKVLEFCVYEGFFDAIFLTA